MKLIKNSIIYIGFEILNKAVPFLLLPIITKALSPVEYGIYGMYQVVLSFSVPLVAMSLDINITRNFFKVTKEEISNILSTILAILHLNTLGVLILIYLITVIWQNPFGIPSRILQILPLIVFVQTVNKFNLTILRNEEKAVTYGLYQMCLTLLNYTTALFLLLVLHKGWASLVFGTLIAYTILSIFSFSRMKRKYRLSLQFAPFRKIFAISLPLVFHLLGGSVIFLSDRIFIQQLRGLEEVGLYSVGNQFGIVTAIVINAIIMAVSPWIYKNLAVKNRRVIPVLYAISGLFVLVGLFVWGTSLVVFPFMVDHAYLPAEDVIFWICLAFVFRGWYQLFYNIVVHEGKTNIFFYTTTFSAILNLVLNYYLIKQYGMIGAAQATAIAFFVMFVIIYLYSGKVSSLKARI